ncbi:hypothetical protein ANN_24014 [Periplaneta americana]|uniref:Reverse transcriptase n=1 Tax=Periplaneta americana TaxID=6978 RepID=A0ABQ8S2F8_PERAM|nr:hypothetical protein ANN_24014 [Periplaneta americana]
MHLNFVRNLHLEQQLSLRRLNINKSSIAPNTKGRQLREILRNRSFESWCKFPHKGKGVILYSECPKANSWMSSKANLSISEYINAIKMSSNLSAVRSVPGRSFNTTRCRHPGCNETETLGHVLGFCRKTQLLRNNRHHKARTDIADVLKRRGWEVHEEIHCVSSLDSNRRADIVAIHRTQSKGIVLDPTIRFERDALQAQHVDEEKKSIYESCIPYLSEKYNIPTSQWSVSGLLFRARGTLPKFTFTGNRVRIAMAILMVQNSQRSTNFEASHAACDAHTRGPQPCIWGEFLKNLECLKNKNELDTHKSTELAATHHGKMAIIKDHSHSNVFAIVTVDERVIVGGRRIKCIRFADDMALLAEEEMILKDMLLELNDSCEQYG